MGWDSDFLQTAVDTCTNASGRIEDCPVFNVVDESEAESCEMTLPDALAKEDVEGPMSELPGGVQITYEDGAGESASASVTAPTSTGSNPTLTYVAGETPSNSASPLPGQAFKEVSMAAAAVAITTTTTIITSSTLPSSSSSDAVVGVEAIPTTAAPVAATSETASFYSTQFVTNGNVVSKILWEEEVVYVTELEEETVTVTVTSTAVVGAPTAAARRRRWGVHMHGHGHRHR